MYLFLISKAIQSLSRTCSVYLVILITLQRYLVIQFPIRARAWLHDRFWQTRLAAGITLLLCILINLPVLCKYKVVENNFNLQNESDDIAGFPFVIKSFGFFKTLNLPKCFNETLLAFDYFIPFPALLISKGLLYFKAS